ncbi:MAG: CPBP family intramembrane glutamic endopeptidase [Promethearchaeota archaeon]
MRNKYDGYMILKFLLMTLVISWSIWIPMALNRLNIIEFEIPIIIGQSIGALGPLISLFVLNRLSKGSMKVKEIFDSIRLKGERSIWLVPAAVLLPLLTIIGNFISFISRNEVDFNIFRLESLESFGFGLIGLIPLLFFTGLLSSPFFEEPCWRGYALGELQRRLGREIGSLLLGTYWWIWHQPINIANGINVTLYSYLLMLSHSLIIDSVYNLSNRNLLSAMFAHSSLIVISIFIYQSTNPYVIVTFLIAIITLRIAESKIKKTNSDYTEEKDSPQPKNSLSKQYKISINHIKIKKGVILK